VHDDEELSGGNAGGEVRRVGGTVRKAWSDSTPSVHAFVRALRDRGIDAPEPLGRDGEGRQMIEFVPGILALDAPRRSSHEIGREPWSSVYVDGHGAHWSAAVDYVTAHRDVWFDSLVR
jgi:hypothetical protein